MNVNFAKRSRIEEIRNVLQRGNLFNVRNEAPTVESLKTKRDEAQAELDALLDDIDERGEVQTEDETSSIQNLTNSLTVLDQKLQRASIRKVRNEADNASALGAMFTGSTVRAGDTKNEAIIETDGDPKIEVDAWKNEADLGYEKYGDFLGEVIDFANGNKFSTRLQHLQSLPNGEGFAGKEQGFKVPAGLMNSCDTGCHMPGDSDLEAIRRPTQNMPVRIMNDESDPLASVLIPMNVPMASRDVRVPYLVSKDSRNGVYGNMEVTDLPDGECYERLSKFKFGALRMESKATYTLACFHRQTIDESMVSIESLFRNGSTIAQQRYKLRSMLRGSNTGHYQGVLDQKTNRSLITIGRKNPGKCTVTHQDILNMMEHAWGYSGSFWGVSSQMNTQLINMSIGLASAGNSTIYTYNPVTGQGQLYGRPVIVTNEFFGCCEICLINPSQIYHGTYQTAQFGRNPWLMWLCDKELFRITQIEAARPAWECPMIQKECPIPISPFVCLGDEDKFPECDEIQDGPYRIKCDPCSSGCEEAPAAPKAEAKVAKAKAEPKKPSGESK